MPSPDPYGVSLKTASGDPLFCGGTFNRGLCYQYNFESGSWFNGPDLLGQRCASAVAELAPGTYWIMSGLDEDDFYTSEYYKDGEFIPGPALPLYGFNIHPCAVQVTEDITFFGNDNAFLYRNSTGEFEDISEGMPYPFYESSCGAATMSDGSRIVVVAGGNINDERLTSVAILNLETNTWDTGPELPQQLSLASVVPTESSFLIVGGYGSDIYDTILEFDPVLMAWVQKEKALAKKRYGAFAVQVEKQKYCP